MGRIPLTYEWVLAIQFCMKAMEMVLKGDIGLMVSYLHPNITRVTLKDTIQKPNLVTMDTALINTARGVGISFYDDLFALEE